MSSEQTAGQPVDLVALRAAALATKKHAEEAEAALLAADPTSEPPPASAPGGPGSTMGGIDLATLESLMTRATPPEGGCVERLREWCHSRNLWGCVSNVA